MYYFHLCNDGIIPDTDGTDLPDDAAAYEHAIRVAQELMFRSDGLLQERWSSWTMSVRDQNGTEIFAFPMDGSAAPGRN
jgi:hypothetical protein